MSRWSGRGQVEPLAALAATFAVCVGVSLYAGVLADAHPGPRDRNAATQAVDRGHEAASDAGVVHPDRLSRATGVAPRGHRLNATLTAADRRWAVGPAPPGNADAATRRVTVRIAPGRVRPGHLRVVVWQ